MKISYSFHIFYLQKYGGISNYFVNLGKNLIKQGIDIQFSKPVYIEDSLNISGKVSYINEAYKQIEIKAVITNQNNKEVSKATIKAGVMDD